MSEVKMYNTFETAKILGMKTRTIRAWIHDGKIKAIKYPKSKQWYVSSSEIERIVKGESVDDNKD